MPLNSADEARLREIREKWDAILAIDPSDVDWILALVDRQAVSIAKVEALANTWKGLRPTIRYEMTDIYGLIHGALK